MKKFGIPFKNFCRELTVFRGLFSLTGIFFRRQKKLLAITVLLGFVAETLAMVMPQLTGDLAGSVDDWEKFRHAGIIFLVVGLVQFIFAVINDVLDRLLKDRLDRDAFCATHEAILRLDPEQFNDNSGGENLLNIQSGRSVVYMLLELICFPVYYGCSIVIGLILLFRSLQGIRLPLWLSIALVSGMAIQPFVTWYFGKLIANAYTVVRNISKRINDELLNDLQAPIELRIMNAIKVRLKKMFAIQHRQALQMDKAMLLHIASRYTMLLLILLFQFAIVISVLLNYDRQNPAIRDLIAAILLVPLMFNHLNKLQQMYNNVKDQEPYIKKLVQLFSTRSRLPVGDVDLKCTLPPDIVFDSVTFGYDKTPVLQNFSFSLPGGKCGALISPAGGGKSTALKLLNRLYLPWQGNIRISGQDIWQINESSFRKCGVVVSQSPLFIAGTIRENFQLMHPDISDEKIISICNKLDLSTILEIPLEKIPDHRLTLGADNLSGGQKKLLALSRALLVKPDFLLLDEPSVGIDGPTIQSTLLPLLQSLKNSMTILLVDHNMNFISAIADEIYIIANGKIVEAGKVDALKSDTGSLFTEYCRQWESREKA